MRHFLNKYLLLELLLTASVLLFSCAGEKSFPTPALIDDIGGDNVPVLPFNPSPQDKTTDNFRLITLSWQGADLDGDTLLYDVYLKTDSIFSGLDQMIAEELSDTFYTLPNPMAPNTTFYWKIELKDNKGNWRFGNVWSFTTGAYNTNPPEVIISIPSNNSTYVINQDILFNGSASDIENGALSGDLLKWSSSRDGQIGTGSLFTTGALSPGLHTITLTAADSTGDEGSAAIQITINDTTTQNNPPTAEITQPDDGLVFGNGAVITFSGTGIDIESGVLTGNSLEWTSSLDGTIGTGSQLIYSELSVGTHTITLRATDNLGAFHEASISLTITQTSAENEEPTAEITTPSSGDVYVQGTMITFTGSGTDPEYGVIGNNSLTWESDRDGSIGTGSPISLSSLSLGSHKIIFRVTDIGGKQDTAMATIFVSRANNTAPKARLKIEIDYPQSDPGMTDVSFDASIIYDVQDPVSDIEVMWDFNNDGVWDTDYSTDKTTSYSYDPDNSPHYVSIIARDPGGLTSEKVFIVPEMVFVPDGNFIMGSTSEYPDNEQLQRTVTIDGYYIDKYEVTNAQYAVFLSDAGNSTHYSSSMDIEELSDGTYIALSGKENYPVVFVDWAAADAFSSWAAKRLPTEAEWEKAARGGDYLDADSTVVNDLESRIYPWGTLLSYSYANYDVTGNLFDGLAQVASYSDSPLENVNTESNASPYGVFDMLGNAGEWVSDYYQMDYYSTAVSTNPSGPASGTYRVMRGGTFDHSAADIRLSRRFSILPTARPFNVGLRCAKTP